MFKKGFSVIFLISLFVTSCTNASTQNDKYFSLIIHPSEGGEVSVKEDVDLSKIKVGTTLNFEAKPMSGYSLESLLVDDTNITSSLKYLFLEEKSYNIFPFFTNSDDIVDENKYGSVVSLSTVNGTFSVNKNEGKVGEEVIITTSPNSGYETTSVKVNDVDTTKIETNKYKFLIAEGENKVSVTFNKISSSEIKLSDLYQASKIKPSRGSLGSIDSYYEPCRGKKGKELKEALHNIIKDHKSFSYSSATAAMKVMDEDPFNSNNMIFTYEGSLPKSTSYNKEHTWAKRHGKFDGIGITEHQKFIGCNLENWQETNEKLFTNAGNKILLTKKHEGVYNIDIENIGYIGFGFVKELQTMISKLIINEYARIYS